MKMYSVLAVIFCFVFNCRAQSDSGRTYTVSLILPFQTEATQERIDAFNNTHDPYSASKVRLDENAIVAFDFYQGVMEALNTNNDSVFIRLNVYDCNDNDTTTAEILAKPELLKSDIIIGAVTSSGGKLVAEFCKKNHILNIQPFSPSKSLTTDNPYHLKLAPTIDAHIDYIYSSIIETYPGANVIIYTPSNERSVNAANRFDSLFNDYNATATTKFTTALLNSKNMTMTTEKATVADKLIDGKKNILIITSFEESFVNGTFRVMYSKLEKRDIITYGMPTWLHGDVMRLDYVNDFHSRISDPYWVDTTKGKDQIFVTGYKNSFGAEPSLNSYLGYDVMNFITRVLGLYGKDFLPTISTQRYSGLAYKFDVMKVMRDSSTINYYENRHVNILEVDQYRLKKVY